MAELPLGCQRVKQVELEALESRGLGVTGLCPSDTKCFSGMILSLSLCSAFSAAPSALCLTQYLTHLRTLSRLPLPGLTESINKSCLHPPRCCRGAPSSRPPPPPCLVELLWPVTWPLATAASLPSFDSCSPHRPQHFIQSWPLQHKVDHHTFTLVKTSQHSPATLKSKVHARI